MDKNKYKMWPPPFKRILLLIVTMMVGNIWGQTTLSMSSERIDYRSNDNCSTQITSGYTDYDTAILIGGMSTNKYISQGDEAAAADFITLGDAWRWANGGTESYWCEQNRFGFVAKLSGDGTVQWEKAFVGTGGSTTEAYNMVVQYANYYTQTSYLHWTYYVAVYYQLGNADYFYILEDATGTINTAIVFPSTYQTFWATAQSVHFYNSNTNEATLTNYRVLIAYNHTTHLTNQELAYNFYNFEDNTYTNRVIASSVLPTTFGLTSATSFDQMLYVGGSYKYGNGFCPVIARFDEVLDPIRQAFALECDVSQGSFGIDIMRPIVDRRGIYGVSSLRDSSTGSIVAGDMQILMRFGGLDEQCNFGTVYYVQLTASSEYYFKHFDIFYSTDVQKWAIMTVSYDYSPDDYVGYNYPIRKGNYFEFTNLFDTSCSSTTETMDTAPTVTKNNGRRPYGLINEDTKCSNTYQACQIQHIQSYSQSAEKNVMYFYNNYISERYHARIGRDYTYNYWSSSSPQSVTVPTNGFGVDVDSAFSDNYSTSQLTVADGTAQTVTITTDDTAVFNWHVAAPTGGGNDVVDLGFTLVSPASGGDSTTVGWLPNTATSYVANDVVTDSYFELAWDATREVFTVTINYASRNRREWKVGFYSTVGSGISGVSTITVCVNQPTVVADQTTSHDVVFMNANNAVNIPWKETSIRDPYTNSWTKYDECKIQCTEIVDASHGTTQITWASTPKLNTDDLQNNMIWVDATTLGTTYTFKIKGYLNTGCSSVYSGNAFDYYISNTITLQVERCTSNGQVYFDVPSDFPATVDLEVEDTTDDQQSTLSWTKFVAVPGTEQEDCFTSYHLAVTQQSDGSAYSSFEYPVSPDTTSSCSGQIESCRDVKLTDISNTLNINVIIYTTDIYGTVRASSTIAINAVCGSGSTTLTIKSGYATSVTVDGQTSQQMHQMNLLEMADITNVNCPILTTATVSETTSNSPSITHEQSGGSNSANAIYEVDLRYVTTYVYTLTIEAEGGATVTTPQTTLVVQCSATTAATVLSGSATTSTSVVMSDVDKLEATQQYTVDAYVAGDLKGACGPSTYQIIFEETGTTVSDHTSGLASVTTALSTTAQSGRAFDLPKFSEPKVIAIKYRVTAEGGVTSDSTVRYIVYECASASSTGTKPALASYPGGSYTSSVTIGHPTSSLTYPQFSCTNMNCCTYSSAALSTSSSSISAFSTSQKPTLTSFDASTIVVSFSQYTTQTAINLYLVGTTSFGTVVYSEQLTVNMVCGYEVVSINSGETDTSKVQIWISQEASATHDYTGFASAFSTTLSGCVVTSYDLRDTTSARAQLSNSALTLSSSSGTWSLATDKSTATVYQFYIRGTTDGAIYNDLHMSITVCDLEVSQMQSDYSSVQTTNLQMASGESNFIVEYPMLTCSDSNCCTYTSIQISTTTGSVTAFSTAWSAPTPQLVSFNTSHIVIDFGLYETREVYDSFTMYLVAVNAKSTLDDRYTDALTVNFVCGYETISLAQGTTTPVNIYLDNTSGQTYAYTGFESSFSTTLSDCPVTSYSLVDSSGNAFSSSLVTVAQISGTWTVSVDQGTAGFYDINLRGSSAGNKYADLKMNIYVCDIQESAFNALYTNLLSQTVLLDAPSTAASVDRPQVDYLMYPMFTCTQTECCTYSSVDVSSTTGTKSSTFGNYKPRYISHDSSSGIKVDFTYVTPTTVTFYLVATNTHNTLSDRYSQQLTVTISCGYELLTLNTYSDSNPYSLYLDQDTSLTHYWTGFETYYDTTINECTVTSYNLRDSSKAAYTASALSVSDSTGSWRVAITQSSSAVHDFYLRGVTDGTIYADLKVMINICEIQVSTFNALYTNILSQTVFVGAPFTAASGRPEVSYLDYPMFRCDDSSCCTYTGVDLSSSSSSVVAFSGSQKPQRTSWDTSLVRIDFSSYTSPTSVTFYLVGYNSQSTLSNRYTQQLTVTIACGYEILSVSSGYSTSSPFYIYLDQASGVQYSWTGFESYYGTDISVCPATTYQLKTTSGSSYSSSVVTISSSTSGSTTTWEVKVLQTTSALHEFYLRAVTDGSIYVDMKVAAKICDLEATTFDSSYNSFLTKTVLVGAPKTAASVAKPEVSYLEYPMFTCSDSDCCTYSSVDVSSSSSSFVAFTTTQKPEMDSHTSSLMKVDFSKYTAPTTVTFWLVGVNTRSSLSNRFTVQLQVTMACGYEIVSILNGYSDTNSYYYYLDTIDNQIHEWTGFESNFQTDIAVCAISSYELRDTDTDRTAFSNSLITISQASSAWKITVNQASSNLHSFYLRGISDGSIYNDMRVDFRVCDLEDSVLQISYADYLTKTILVGAPSTAASSAKPEVSYIEYPMFTCSVSDCCTYPVVGVSTSGTSNTAFSGTPAPNYQSKTSLVIKVDFASYTSPGSVSFWLVGTNSQSTLSDRFSQQLTVNIACGYETISVNSGETDISAINFILEMTASTTYSWTGWESFFSTNIAVCPLQTYTLHNQTTDTAALTSSVITLSGSTITVDQSIAEEYTFYLRATSLGGISNDLKVRFRICGYEGITYLSTYTPIVSTVLVGAPQTAASVAKPDVSYVIYPMYTCTITECCVYNSVTLSTAASSNTPFSGSPAPNLVSFDSSSGIKVDFSAYTSPTAITLYLRAANSLSQLSDKYSQLVTINVVCGYEIITSNSGQTDPLAYALTIDRQNAKYSWTGFQSYFSSDMAICPVNAIYVRDINYDMNELNDPYLTLSDTTSNGVKTWTIEVDQAVAYVHHFNLRAETDGVGLNMESTITVCGSEKIEMATSYDTSGATINEIYSVNGFYMDTYNQNTNLRYYTIAKATYTEWFDLSPSNTTCTITSYRLCEDQGCWVVLERDDIKMDTDGTIKIDRESTSLPALFFVEAKTRGLISLLKEVNQHLCATNSISTTGTYTAIYSKNNGTDSKMSISRTDWETYLKSSCTACPVSDLSVYTWVVPSGSTIDISMDGDNIQLSTASTLQTISGLQLDLHFPTSNTCSELQHVQLNLDLQVCGFETIKVANSTSYEFVINETVTLKTEIEYKVLETLFSYDGISECGIKAIYVSYDTSTTKTTMNDDHVKLIYRNDDNSLIIDWTYLRDDIVFEGFVVAETYGENTAYKPIKITFIFPVVNKAPIFDSWSFPALKIQTTSEVAETAPSFEYQTPKITDETGDKISYTLVGTSLIPCQCLLSSINSDQITLALDLSRLSSGDTGKYDLKFELYDDQYSTSLQKQIYEFTLEIEYEYIPVIIEEETVEEAVEFAEEIEEEVIEDIVEETSQIIEPAPNPYVSKIDPKVMDELFSGWDNVPEEPKKDEEEKKVPEDVKMKVGNVTRDGRIQMGFNQEIQVPPFIKQAKKEEKDQEKEKSKRALVNSVSLDELDATKLVSVSFILNSESDTGKLKFFVEITEWSGFKFELFLNFTDPLMVSKGHAKDKVIVRILNPKMFRSAVNGKTMKGVDVTTVSEIKTQLPFGINEEDLKQSATQASDSMQAFMIVQLIVSLFLKGALDDLFSLFFTIQIICFLQVYDTPMPGNVGIFLDAVKEIVQFNILKPDSLIKLVNKDFDLDEFIAKYIKGNLKKLAITPEDEKRSIVKDLRVYLFVIGFVALIVIIAALLYVFLEDKRPLIEEKVTKAKKKFFWNGAIRSLSISYIETAAVMIFQLRKPWLIGVWDLENKEVMAGIVGSGVLILYPVICAYVIQSHSVKNLQTPLIKSRIGNLYLDIKMSRRNWGKFYYPVFILRRFIFIGIPVLFVGRDFYQLQALISLSSIYVTNYAQNLPHVQVIKQRLELFNESTIMIVNYHMLCYTLFVQDLNTQFLMGYSMTGLLIFIILVNMAVMLYNMVLKLKRKLRRMSIKKLEEKITKAKEKAKKEKKKQAKEKRKQDKNQIQHAPKVGEFDNTLNNLNDLTDAEEIKPKTREEKRGTGLLRRTNVQNVLQMNADKAVPKARTHRRKKSKAQQVKEAMKKDLNLDIIAESHESKLDVTYN